MSPERLETCLISRCSTAVPPSATRLSAAAAAPPVASAGVQIEPLPERLYGAAVALWLDTGLTRPWNDPEDDLRRAMAGSTSTILACTDGDRLLATAMVGHDGHRGWVYYVAVDRSEQRRRLGQQLMRACQEWLRERGVPKIQLMVRNGNNGVISFYERLGYTASEVVVLGLRLDQ